MSVGWVRQVQEVLGLASVEAPPFVPAHLKQLFEQQPVATWQDPQPLAHIFQARHAALANC